MIEVGVRTCMRNHTYEAGGEVKLQSKGGGNRTEINWINCKMCDG